MGKRKDQQQTAAKPEPQFSEEALRAAMRQAGKKGGATRKEQLGTEGFAALGRKGGGECMKRHGKKFYREMGKKAGEKILEERGREYFAELGRRGGARVREMIRSAKAQEAAQAQAAEGTPDE